MTAEKRETVEDLAFNFWILEANELAYNNKMISKHMYEYAKQEIKKEIDTLGKICYTYTKVGDSYGFIEGTKTA